jgi:hypothetical protein
MTGTENTVKLEKAIGESRESLKKESEHGTATMTALVKQIYQIEKIKKIGWWTLKLFSILVVGVVLSYLGIKSISASDPNLGYFLLTLGVAEFLIPLFVWMIPAYKKIDGEAKLLAEKKAEEAVKSV